MPWVKYFRDRVMNLYPNALRKIGEHKFKNPDIPLKELMIRGEVLKRDFTKRQMNIISLIFSFSYYLGKERAVIPKMQDFELAGVSKVKIRNELLQLVEMDIIDWNEEDNTFAIKDIRGWKAKYHSGYNDERSTELFKLNLKDAGIIIEEEK